MGPSMKALPKRKGNTRRVAYPPVSQSALNESPSKKEGKFLNDSLQTVENALNESPSKKEGKSFTVEAVVDVLSPSMKALPKRKGNSDTHTLTYPYIYPQ